MPTAVTAFLRPGELHFSSSSAGPLSCGIKALSSEQAAYGLVAYDRFKNNKNTLYDMSDVFCFGIGSGTLAGSTSGGVTAFAVGTAANAPVISVSAPASGWVLDGSTANSFNLSYCKVKLLLRSFRLR